MRRRRLVLIAGSLLLALVCLTGSPVAAEPANVAGGTGDTTVTTLEEPPEGGGIIPRPNTGSEPEDSGDRGGALQTVLFVAMLAGVGVIVLLVVRESRKARAERGF